MEGFLVVLGIGEAMPAQSCSGASWTLEKAVFHRSLFDQAIPDDRRSSPASLNIAPLTAVQGKNKSDNTMLRLTWLNCNVD